LQLQAQLFLHAGLHNLCPDDTIKAKKTFESFAHCHHVVIQHYHWDNGIFASKKFRAAIDSSNQSLSLCGVNAHHKMMELWLEHHIQNLTDCTWAMLLNAVTTIPWSLTTFGLLLCVSLQSNITSYLTHTSQLAY
jgi:hypothetical protein